MNNTTTNYVCCDVCFKKYGGAKSKPDISSIFAIMPNTRSIKLNALIDLWNGGVYKIPLCCVWYFFKLSWKGLRPAITTSFIRFEDGGNFSTHFLNEHEVSYINKKRIEKGFNTIQKDSGVNNYE